MHTAELRKICQKGQGEIFLISNYVYRPFTIYFSRVYIALGLRGNTITFHSLLAGLAACGLVLLGSPNALFTAAACLQIYFILDHVDGEVARFDLYRGKQKPSLAGEFFDFWTHFHTINLVFSFMGLGMFVQTGNLIWAVLGILACNFSGNFNRMPMANIVLCGLARNQIRADDPKLAPILDVCCGVTQRERFARKLPWHKTAYLFVNEFLAFPGNVIALTAVLIADGILSIAEPGAHPFRATYLIVYCAYGLLSKIARTIVSIRQLKELPLQR